MWHGSGWLGCGAHSMAGLCQTDRQCTGSPRVVRRQLVTAKDREVRLPPTIFLLQTRVELVILFHECCGRCNFLQCFDAVGWAAGRAFSL